MPPQTVSSSLTEKEVDGSADDLYEFVSAEYARTSDYAQVIQAARDRYITNYMTVAVALLGGLALVLKDTDHIHLVSASIFAEFVVVALVCFGLATCCVLCGNLVTRAYYKQRRNMLLHDLIKGRDEKRLRASAWHYVNFKRKDSKWFYRGLSIYFQYISSIAAANTLATMTLPSLLGYRLKTWAYVIWFILGITSHHLACLAYLKRYTRMDYNNDA